MYDIVFLSIPNELLMKLKENYIKQCKFYVCTSEDVRSMKVLDGRPLDCDIAKTDSKGNNCAYKTETFLLE